MCRDLTKLVPNDPCPECKEKLCYDEGHGPTFSGTEGTPPFLYCDCGFETNNVDSDWVNLQNDRKGNIIWGTHDEF